MRSKARYPWLLVFNRSHYLADIKILTLQKCHTTWSLPFCKAGAAGLDSHQVVLSCNTDDTASRAGTSIASLLRLLVATLAKIIGTGVYHDGTS